MEICVLPSKPKRMSPFPCLLEKAVAKFVMSYHRIDGGFEASALDAWIFRMGTT